MRTRQRNGFTSSHTTHTIHATGSRAKLSTKKSIKSIAVDQSRVESREGSKVESIDRVDRQLSWIDRVARLYRFRGLACASGALRTVPAAQNVLVISRLHLGKQIEDHL